MEHESIFDELFPSQITKISSNNNLISPSYKLTSRLDRQRKILHDVIDVLGAASARVQNLPQIVTSLSKFKYSDQCLYIIREPHDASDPMPFGFLKVGRKKLFIFDCFDEYHEVDPICVLDFYISDNFQRKGFGQCLFQEMLADENLSAENLAIDSPSDKMLSFMRKHYHLDKPLWQTNNFVVYPEFFRELRCNDKFLTLQKPDTGISRNNKCLKRAPNESSFQLTPPGNLPPINQNHSMLRSTRVSPISRDEGLSNSSNRHSENDTSAELLLNSLQFRSPPPIKVEAGTTSLNTNITDQVLSPPFSNGSDLETWRRLSNIPRDYSYQSAVRMHNKHTRLW